jgi:hydrogenase maturation protease
MSGASRAPVVVALGSALRRDDGVGPVVLERLSGGLRAAGIRHLSASPLDLFGWWDQVPLAVVIDACRGGLPGSVHAMEADADGALDHTTGPPTASSHGLGVLQVLRASRLLGTAPDRVIFVAVSGLDFGPGVGLSPAVAAAVRPAAGTVLEVLTGGPTAGCGS